jgi:hypothetical protein
MSHEMNIERINNKRCEFQYDVGQSLNVFKFSSGVSLSSDHVSKAIARVSDENSCRM